MIVQNADILEQFYIKPVFKITGLQNYLFTLALVSMHVPSAIFMKDLKRAILDQQKGIRKPKKIMSIKDERLGYHYKLSTKVFRVDFMNLYASYVASVQQEGVIKSRITKLEKKLKYERY